jgi:hypothetical protein
MQPLKHSVNYCRRNWINMAPPFGLHSSTRISSETDTCWESWAKRLTTYHPYPMLKYVEICWNMLRLWLCVSVIFCLAFLTVFCFMFSPHQSSALGGEEKMFSVRRSKACPALRSGRISHHAGPWIQFALYQLQWTHESEFGFAWQAHGAWGAWGAGYGVQGPFCLNSEGVGTILNAANMLQLVFSDALHSRSMDEVTRSPACYSVSPGVF